MALLLGEEEIALIEEETALLLLADEETALLLTVEEEKAAAVEEELEIPPHALLQVAPVTLTLAAAAKVTAVVWDIKRPFTVVPTPDEAMVVPAKIDPTKVVEPPNVAVLPATKYTLQAVAPLVKTTAALTAVVKVDPI
jgi:hypothetical protein